MKKLVLILIKVYKYIENDDVVWINKKDSYFFSPTHIVSMLLITYKRIKYFMYLFGEI